MNNRLLRRIKCAGILSSPVIIGAIMVLSLLVGPVSGTVTATITDDCPPDYLITDQGPPQRNQFSALALNMEATEAEYLVSVEVVMTRMDASFNPTSDISLVELYKDEPDSINGVWELAPDDTSIGSVTGAAFAGGPHTWTATITAAPSPRIPSDDFWENEGADFFIVVTTAGPLNDGEQFSVSITTGGITVTGPTTLTDTGNTQTITCDDTPPDMLPNSGTPLLTVSSDMPNYFDDDDILMAGGTVNNVNDGYNTDSDCIYFNDLPGMGSDQVVTITLSNYVETNAYAFYGDIPYFNEDPRDVHEGPPYPYSGTFSIDYKLTWTESDTTGGDGGLNKVNTMTLWLEDRVGYRDDYMDGNFHFIQDDDAPMSVVDFASVAGDEVFYYDESQNDNWLAYVDEYNTINVYTTDQWWFPPAETEGGSGFDDAASYGDYRVGRVVGGSEEYWVQQWQPCVDETGVGIPINVQTEIVQDGTIGGGEGYYFIEFRSQDDVMNTINVGDGNYEINVLNHPAGFDGGGSDRYFDASRIYFKIVRDYSIYRGLGDTVTWKYDAPALATTNLSEAAISVGHFNIGLTSNLELFDTEIFLDSSYAGERHVDVQGTLTTGSLINTVGYDGRSAFSHRGIPDSHAPGGLTDEAYTFWVRNGATLDMVNTVVEGCGFDTTDETQDDRGLYIRTPYNNALISNSEVRLGYAGIVIQDEGGAEIVDSDIWGNTDKGIYAINAQSDIDITGCYIYKNGGDGIMLDGCSALIDDNDISYNGRFGVYVESGEFEYYYPDGDMGWATITNNDIYDNTGQGILIYGSFYAPETAHSGDMAFYSGTGNDVDRSLTNSIDLSSVIPGDQITMTFWLWYNTAGDVEDGFNILYYNLTQDSWLPIEPTGVYDYVMTDGYPLNNIEGLDDQRGFAEHNTLTYWTTDGWTQVEYDLSQFAGNSSTTLRFRYGSDERYYGTGVMIDDILVFNRTERFVDDDASSFGTDWTPNGWQVLDVPQFSATETLIQNNDVIHNGDDGILVEYSDIDVLDNTVYDNSGEGVYFNNFVEGVIDNNIIDSSADENIQLEDWVDAIVTNNEITASDGRDGIDAEDFCRVLIDSNLIADNDRQGIYANSFCDLTITNNEISFNDHDPGDYEALDIEGYGTIFNIDNNVITYNNHEGIYTYECYGLVDGLPQGGGSNFYWAQGYDDEINHYMTFEIDLSMASSATLRFDHAYKTQSGDDGGFVEYWNGSSRMWETLFPVEGYISPYITGDGNGPNGGDYYGYEGYSGGWTDAAFDLSMLITGSSEPVTIRFHFTTDGSTMYGGGWASHNIEVRDQNNQQIFFDGAEGTNPMFNMGFQKSTGVWNYITNNIITHNEAEGVYLEET
ncbi:MAG: right-handed parallel beta-helix repeat-containing protein, partial [Thermoplasmata archaeon]